MNPMEEEPPVPRTCSCSSSHSNEKTQAGEQSNGLHPIDKQQESTVTGILAQSGSNDKRVGTGLEAQPSQTKDDAATSNDDDDETKGHVAGLELGLIMLGLSLAMFLVALICYQTCRRLAFSQQKENNADASQDSTVLAMVRPISTKDCWFSCSDPLLSPRELTLHGMSAGHTYHK